jgi:hypothetical protein
MPESLPSDVVRACVVARGTDTKYLRAGRGEPVLVLAGDPAVAQAIVIRLPRRFRALAPEAPPPRVAGARTTGDFASWTRDFLDALGVGRVAVIADPSFAGPALGLAILDPDRVDRIALLVDRTGDADSYEGSIADRLAHAGQPLIIAHFDGTLGEGLTATLLDLGSFLDGDPPSIHH